MTFSFGHLWLLFIMCVPSLKMDTRKKHPGKMKVAGVLLTIAPTERQLVYKTGFLAPYAQCVKRVYFLLFASPIMPIFGYVIGVGKRRSRIQSCEDLEAFLRGWIVGLSTSCVRGLANVPGIIIPLGRWQAQVPELHTLLGHVLGEGMESSVIQSPCRWNFSNGSGWVSAQILNFVDQTQECQNSNVFLLTSHQPIICHGWCVSSTCQPLFPKSFPGTHFRLDELWNPGHFFFIWLTDLNTFSEVQQASMVQITRH